MQLANPYEIYLKGDSGKGVLLIHGLTGAPAEMKLVAKQLHRQGYSVYAPLLAGHGVDTQTLVKTRWQDWQQSVEEAARMLKTQTDEIFAAGICVGGKLAMMAAHAHPSLFRAIAIYSPCFQYDGWNVPFYYPLLSYNISWLSRIPFLNRLSFSETESIGIKDERLRRMMQGMAAEGVIEDFPGKGLVEMHRLGKTLKKTLPQMRTPTLILQSPEDDLGSPEHARYISRHIGAPHELHWIEDSYHMIHVDRQHHKVANLTADFFEKHYDNVDA
jgi:carboxylesterase